MHVDYYRGALEHFCILLILFLPQIKKTFYKNDDVGGKLGIWKLMYFEKDRVVCYGMDETPPIIIKYSTSFSRKLKIIG